RAGFSHRMTMKGVSGNWSIKDILAHILAYEQYIADRLEEVRAGQVYVPCKTQTALDAFRDEFGYPDFGSPLLNEDGPNEWIIEKYKNIALDDIVAQELQAFTSILSSIERMSESLLNQHNLFERIANNTYRHYHEHAVEIRRWLKSTASKQQ
ncbi:MAG TPA: hypothetical protein VMT73_09110, partial [Anaerolineales bacterium]|nr:hypothetical protein [Anaerolineales bacterium]